MALPEYRGLRQWEANQRKPIGTLATSMEAPTPLSRQYRQQAELYNTAMRTLRRQARRGDVGAALTAIRVRDDANEKGYTPGGIQDSRAMDAGAAGYEQGFADRAADREMANRLDRQYAREALQRTQSPAMGAAAPEPTTPDYEANPPKNERQMIDQNLGRAVRLGEDTTSLAEQAGEAGVSQADFERRKKWWEINS